MRQVQGQTVLVLGQFLGVQDDTGAAARAVSGFAFGPQNRGLSKCVLPDVEAVDIQTVQPD